MATTTPLTHRHPRPTPGFPDLLRSEWTKLTTLRSTWWSLAAMIGLSVGLTAAATSVLTAQWDSLDAATRTQFRSDTIGLILQPGAQFAQVAVCVLGVLLMASEYSTGMIRSSVLAAPRRTPVLAAKVAVFAGLVFVLAELVALPCFLLGSSITSAHADVSLTSWTSLRAIVCFGVYMALIGVIALAVGTLVRHPAGGISLILAFQFVLPGVLGLIPGSVGEHIAQALPANTSVMMGSGHNASDVYSPATGFLLLLAWAGLLLTAARWSLKKRNV